MKKTVLVATMYSGEGDFDRCCEMVKAQSWGCEHLIIKNLPEVEAHLQLYKTFKESGHDFLLKLDADMVLKSKDTVKLIVGRMGDFWRVTHYVDDYFTGMKMNGIHMFSSKNKWDFDGFTPDCLKPDRLDILHTQRKRYKHKQKTRGDMLAYHCHYSNDRQAFHFGYHSLLKHEHKRLGKFLTHYDKHPSDNKLQMVGRGILAARNSMCYNSYDYNDGFDKIFAENNKRSISPDRATRMVKSGLESVRENRE